MSAPVTPDSASEIPNTTPASTVVEEANDLPRTREELDVIRQNAARETAAQMMGALGEKQRLIDDLTARLSAPAPVVESSPRSLVEEVTGSQFLEKPMEHVGRAVETIVEKLLDKQLAPMKELMSEFHANRQQENALAQLTADPYNAQILKAYPNEIKLLLANIKNPTLQDIEGAITMIPGLIARGRVPNRIQNDSPSNLSLKGGQPGTGNIPPSSPAAPRRESTKVEVTLTDAEENVRRRMGISKERFVELRDNPNQDTWATPKAEKK